MVRLLSASILSPTTSHVLSPPAFTLLYVCSTFTQAVPSARNDTSCAQFV